jgi:hypothetical protein
MSRRTLAAIWIRPYIQALILFPTSRVDRDLERSTFRNFFSTNQLGPFVRHQNLFGIVADIPLNSGCTFGGRGSFQSVKLQRPDRDTVCSHSLLDATANVEAILYGP